MLVRSYTGCATTYVNVDTATAAASAAGLAGIAPAVMTTDTASGLIVMADLTESHKTATLADLDSAERVAALFAVRASVDTAQPKVAREMSVFDDISALHALARRAGAAIPAEMAFLRRTLGDAEQRISAVGHDIVFRHGDGNLSNVMLAHDDDTPVLVDWDWSGLMDPLQDVGVTLVELADDENHARELFEIACGSIDESLFARAMIYGFADHVRQAMVGILVDALDPGTHEYSKYGDWQLLRARMALSSNRCHELLRRINA
ncbi:phosphotransferase [Gordonia sp. L191]|uniref:phosphotransferase family protein n=1 Tax=Gordonia sp. L191 TaxID=2982699 RepID=UPI0024BF7EA6|nr:phosphotransferase [Gordonia sp. L191]WHU46200.1 phosphotransferase [Gordonia sp. L191]